MDFYQPLRDKLASLWSGAVATVPMLVIALVVLLLTWLSALVMVRVLRKVLKKTQLRTSLQDLLTTLAKVGVWCLGLLIAVTIIFPSLTPAKLLTALGLGSVAVGLAFKDIFENFFAGILIMLRRPMNLGDFVECEGVEGKVERISVRETYIRQVDDQLVLVPNSFLFKNPLNVVTDKTLRRYEIVVGIAYGEDVDTAREVIYEAVEAQSLVAKERPIEVYAREFNSSSLDFTVRWWASPKPLDMHKSRDQIVTAIKYGLDQAGIEIPFPYRTLVFKDRELLAGALANESRDD